MAYKKYITKNGKIYGPYVYHSKRINGKVVSEYRGMQEKKKAKKVLISIIAVVLVLSLIFWILFFRSQLSGKIILDIEGTLSESELTQGKINLILNQGELIPLDSKIILENNETTYKYNLRELLREEETSSGTFYMQESDLSGFGEGYGFPGTIEEYPTIYFKLDITPKRESTGGVGSPDIIKEPVEEPIEETEEKEKKEKEEKIKKSTKEKSAEEIEEGSPVPITGETTGNIITGIFSSVSNFFTALTGGTIEEEKFILEAEVSKESDFTYTKIKNKQIKIIPGSIQTDGNQLPLNVLETTTTDNELTIKTDYTITKKGFGEEYLGEIQKALIIDLEKLNITLVEGDLTIKLTYDGSQILLFEETISEETVAKIQINDSIEELVQELFNQTINVTFDFNLTLTDEEKEAIKNKFDFPVVQTDINTYRDRFLATFTIDGYTIEHSYSKNLTKDELEKNIKRDQILWLKDLLNSFEEETYPKEKVEEIEADLIII